MAVTTLRSPEADNRSITPPMLGAPTLGVYVALRIDPVHHHDLTWPKPRGHRDRKH